MSLIPLSTMDNNSNKQPLLKPITTTATATATAPANNNEAVSPQQPPPQPQPEEEDRYIHTSSLTTGVVVVTTATTINASGPQLCYSPPPCYDAISGTPTPNIQGDDGEPAGPREGGGGGGGGTGEIRVYGRRWYVLLLYSLLAATQGGVWNIYGPIAATVEDVFGWTDSTVALLTNWGPIAYLLAGLVFSWMLDVKGLRLACIITMLLVAVGTAIKCITFDTPIVTWLTHVGQFLNGLGGPVAMAAPPILSAVWFPPRERTTATALGAILNYMGVAAAFVMGPQLMHSLPNETANNSSTFSRHRASEYNSVDYSFNDSTELFTSKNETDADRFQSERKAIALYTYIGAGWSAFVLLLFLVYFPNKPPLPPCPSAAIPRENFLQGLKLLLKRGQFWVVTMIYGASLGTLNCWSSVLDVILKPYGISENDAGWIGFYAICSACLVSLIIARFADSFKRIMKWLILVTYTIGTAVFVVFALAIFEIIPSSTVLFYVTIITGITALNAAVPLFFELSCELSYPVGEGTTNMVLTIVNNVFGLIFLLLMMIPGIGSEWTIWLVVGTSGGCLPFLFLLKANYNRLQIDEHNPSLRAEVLFPAPQQ